jgi:methyl-accepting chemotaxis protein
LIPAHKNRDLEWKFNLFDITPQETLEAAKGGDVIEYQFNDEDTKAVVLGYDELGVYILSSIHDDDIALMLQSMRNSILLSAVCLSLVTLMLIGVTITRYLKPLKILTSTIIKTEKKVDFSRQIRVKTMDEVGQASAAFNSLTDSLKENMSNVIKTMQGIAAGNLLQSLPTDKKGEIDKLNRAINSSIDLLGDTLSQISSSSTWVAYSADQLATTAQDLASGTSKQAASMEEISSSLTEVGAQTKSNGDNAVQAQQLSNQALSIVEQSNDQMEEMLVSMNDIDSTSSNMVKIIKVIDEIAFQTNLLALNAAVEAARAGKYGKGFAVVAGEVRSLASRSAEAAKNTTELIENSMKQIQDGVSNSDKTAQMLVEIKEAVIKINDTIGEIANASGQQTKGITEINNGVNQVNNVVRQISSISEETASASQELNNQAAEMQSLIGKFKLPKAGFHGEPGSAGPRLATLEKAIPQNEIVLDEDTPG